MSAVEVFSARARPHEGIVLVELRTDRGPSELLLTTAAAREASASLHEAANAAVEASLPARKNLTEMATAGMPLTKPNWREL